MSNTGRLKLQSTESQPRNYDEMPDLARSLWPSPTKSGSGETVALSELATVRRGVATGANAWFFLADVERDDLPSDACLPAVRRLRHARGAVLDQDAHDSIGAAGHPRWLLDLSEPAHLAVPAVARRIESGLKAGYDGRYLTSLREHWYVTELVSPPDILLGTMGKGRLRAVWNEVGAVPSNSMYGVYLNDPSIAGELVQWFETPTGQRAIRREARHYSNGLMKLEPRAGLRIQVPRRFASNSVPGAVASPGEQGQGEAMTCHS